MGFEVIDDMHMLIVSSLSPFQNCLRITQAVPRTNPPRSFKPTFPHEPR